VLEKDVKIARKNGHGRDQAAQRYREKKERKKRKGGERGR
jgi:hypothetical protein